MASSLLHLFRGETEMLPSQHGDKISTVWNMHETSHLRGILVKYLNHLASLSSIWMNKVLTLRFTAFTSNHDSFTLTLNSKPQTTERCRLCSGHSYEEDPEMPPRETMLILIPATLHLAANHASTRSQQNHTYY